MHLRGVAARVHSLHVVPYTQLSYAWRLELAQKIEVTLVDDLDGSPASQTVRFALAGAEYEIELNEQHAARFRQQINPFIVHARRTARTRARGAGRGSASRRQSQDIREWARAQGIQISERGRIPGAIVEQYEVASLG
jgi:hypothetical protein